jgi:hypothetical protein
MSNEFITEVSSDSLEYYLYNEFFHYMVLQYKICEFDIRGALEDEQWDVVVTSVKNCLFYAISAYLYTKGCSPSSVDYIALEQLRLRSGGTQLIKMVETLFYSNPLTPDEVIRDANILNFIVDEFLIPKTAWEIWGKGRQFNFSAYLETILKIKDIDEGIEKLRSIPITSSKELVAKIREIGLRVTKGK